MRETTERLPDLVASTGSSGQQSSFITFVLLPVIRYRYTALAFVLLGLVGGVLAGIPIPDVYTSQGKLLFRMSAGERKDITSGNDGSANMRNEDVQSERVLLESIETFKTAAARISKEIAVQPYNPGKNDDEDTPFFTRKRHQLQSWWHHRQRRAAASSGEDKERVIYPAGLKARTQIRTEGRSFVFSLTHASHDPDLAQRSLDIIMKECIARHNTVFASTDEYDHLADEALKKKEDLNAAEEKLRDYRHECGVYSFPEQKAATLSMIKRHDEDTQETELRMQTIEAEIEEYTRQLALVPDKILKIIPSTKVSNRTRENKQSDLEEKRAERQQLLLEFEEYSPAVQAIDVDIQSLEEAIAGMDEFTITDAREEWIDNGEYIRIKTEIGDREVEYKGLEQQANARMEFWTAEHSNLRQLENCRAQLEDHEQRVEILRSEVRRITQQLEKYRFYVDLKKADYSSLKVIEPASYRARPTGPNHMKLVLLGLFLGIGSGGAAAFTLNTLNRTVRRPEDLEELDLRVLAVVPESRGWRRAVRSVAAR